MKEIDIYTEQDAMHTKRIALLSRNKIFLPAAHFTFYKNISDTDRACT